MTYKKETTRRDRMHNIATAMIEISTDQGTKGARTRNIRAHIRQKLKMEELTGEAHKGDLKAHGDAIGGHGLNLEITRQNVQGKPERVVFFTKENLKACKDFLEAHQICEIF